jgi:hypothetical protein
MLITGFQELFNFNALITVFICAVKEYESKMCSKVKNSVHILQNLKEVM